MKKLGLYIRYGRVKAGLTQKQVSDKLGYTSAQFISNWERGLSSPPLDKIREIVEICRMDPEDLIKIIIKEQEHTLRTALFKTMRTKKNVNQKGSNG